MAEEPGRPWRRRSGHREQTRTKARPWRRTGAAIWRRLGDSRMVPNMAIRNCLRAQRESLPSLLHVDARPLAHLSLAQDHISYYTVDEIQLPVPVRLSLSHILIPTRAARPDPLSLPLVPPPIAALRRLPTTATHRRLAPPPMDASPSPPSRAVLLHG